MGICKIELSLSPLSSQEVELALQAVRHIWQQPEWVARQPCKDAWLLCLRHEANFADENLHWFAERLAAAIWQALGRYIRIALDITQDENDQQSFLFGESDYWQILRDYRLSSHLR